MLFIEIDELKYRINQLKKELTQIAEATGLNSHETICCSQKLDQDINKYQRILAGRRKLVESQRSYQHLYNHYP